MATPATHLRQWFTPRWWSEALRALRRPPGHPFDRAYGVDTGGLIYADRLAGGHAHAAHNAGYYATAPSLFHGAIALWRETLPGTGYGVEDYTLVDIGCGKGRVLLMASEYRFHEIIGVELDSGLATIARKNLRKWQRRVPRIGVHQDSLLRPGKSIPRIRILDGDALSLPIPDAPVALFYFNSFERPMMEIWLARLGEIARERTAPLDLIYIHPEFDGLVRRVPEIRVLTEADIPFSAEDAGADEFGVDSDHCAAYRLGG